MNANKFVIGIVGPCAAGKSSLVKRLRNSPYEIRHICQEHSYVQDMWRRISNPHILIYLDVSYENTILRKQLNWTFDEYQEQIRRLTHAREHAQLVINTNPLNEEEVFQQVREYLDSYFNKIDTH